MSAESSRAAIPLVPLMLGSAAFVFLNFSLPIYARELGASAMAIGGTYTVFTITLIFIRPLVGVALDRYGRRSFYISAFAFYAIAMLSFGFSSELTGLYVARFLQGIGAALLWVSLKTMTADIHPINERGEAMGRVSALSVRGSMLGAFYGFTLLGMWPLPQAWFWAFAGYAALAALGFVLALRKTHETQQSDEFGSPAKITLTQQPARLLQLLAIVALTGFASALLEPIYLIYLRDKFELSIIQLALCFFPAGLIFAVLPIYGGRLADRIGHAVGLALGVLLAGLISISLPLMPGVIWVAVLYTISAVGWSMADPAEDALYASLADEQHRGQLFGYKEMSGGVGSALGPLAGGAIYDHATPGLAFGVNGLLMVVCALAVYWLFAAKAHPSSR